MIAWGCAYGLAARFTMPTLACIITILVSCNPVSLSYERVASTDVISGMFVIASVACIFRRTPISTMVAGLLLGAAYPFKLTALLWTPMVFLMLWVRTENRLRDLIFFLVPMGIILGLGKIWVHQQLQSNPFLLTDSVWKATQADPGLMLRALSSFPKYPFNMHMGLLLHALIIFPMGCLLVFWTRHGGRITLSSAIFLGFAFLVVVFATQTFNSARYFVSATYFLPLLLVLGRRCVWKVDASAIRVIRILLGCWTGFLIVYWVPLNLHVDDLGAFASGEAFNPRRVVWLLFWPKLLVVVGVIVLAVNLGFRCPWTRKTFFVVSGIFVLLTLFMFSNYTHSYGDVFGTIQQQSYLRSMSFSTNQVVLQLGVGGLALLLIASKTGATWRRWFGGWVLLLIGFCAFNTHWRTALGELPFRQYENQKVVQRIVNRIPPGSVVVGQRASSLLRSTDFRTGFGSANGHQVFIPGMLHLLEHHPEREIYWLVESNWDPFWTDYTEKAQNKLKVDVVDTLELRSMLSSGMIPVYLVRVTER